MLLVWRQTDFTFFSVSDHYASLQNLVSILQTFFYLISSFQGFFFFSFTIGHDTYALTLHWWLPWTSTHWIWQTSWYNTHTCWYQVECAYASSRLFTEAQGPITTKWNKLLMLVFMNHWCTSTFLFPKVRGIEGGEMKSFVTMEPIEMVS